VSNWHVVSYGGKPIPTKSLTIQTVDRRKHFISPKKIVRVGKLDLAILEFQSPYRYATASIGNYGIRTMIDRISLIPSIERRC
jgi:hypothetical protein